MSPSLRAGSKPAHILDNLGMSYQQKTPAFAGVFE
jgi:hypothetical protein